MIKKRPFVDTNKFLCQHIVYMDIQLIVNKYKKLTYSRQELLDAGITPRQLRTLTAKGDVYRIGHGIYRVAAEGLDDAFYDQMYREATKIAGPKSVVCLLSALEYYHLTDVITDSVWLMVPFEKRVRSNKITLLRTRNPHWTIGIKRMKGFRITTLERTLVDSLNYHKKIARPIAIEAIQRAITSKKTTLAEIGDMARELNVRKKLQPIFEALM